MIALALEIAIVSVGLAAVLLRGPWWVLAIGIGSLLVKEPEFGAASFAIVAVDVVEALVVAKLLRGVCQIHLALDRRRDVVAFVVVVAAVTLAGALARCVFAGSWRSYWWAHAGGDLILVPLALTWSTRQATSERGGGHVIEAFALGFAVIVVGGFVAFRWMPDWMPGAREAYLVPLLLWTGLRFGPRGAAMVNFAIAGLAVLTGELQTFLPIAVATTLFLSALGAEREQKVRERTFELKRRDEQLREAQGLAHLGSFEHDLVADRLDWSDELYRIFGREPGSFVPTMETALSCVHAQDRSRVARLHALARVIGRPFSYEARILRPDGEQRVVQCQAKVHIDRSSQPTAITGCCQDITERKRADEARYRLAELVASSEDAIIQLSLDGIIENWNTGAANIFGYAADEVVGKSMFVLVPPSEIDEVERRLEYVREGHHLTHYEQVHRRRDGTVFDASVTTSAIFDREGHVIGLSKVLRDISAQKAADDRLRQSLREKDALLREIHHRVKNNLQLISSLLNLQLATVPNHDSRRSLVESQSRIQSMALVHQLLYKSHDLAGIEIREYLKALVGRLVATYRVGVDEICSEVTAPDIELDIDHAIPCGLIVNELVTNSLTHAFHGRARGKVEVALARENDHLVLEVRDDGVGTPPEIDFDSVATFGLRIAKILAAQLKGTISLAREGGTRVRVEFPWT